MNRQQFDGLVERLETRYVGRDHALRRATIAWLILGIALIAGWLLLWLLCGAALFVQGIMLAGAGGIVLIVLGGLLVGYAIVEAASLLIVGSPALEGRRLQRHEAAALWHMLGELQAQLGYRSAPQTVFTLEFNAGVREVPRLGFLGYSRSYLELGLPLLQTLSADELRSVLAHEFAHLSSRHGQTGHRIYRLHRIWETVVQQLQRPASGRLERWSRKATTAMLSWYWPRFHARAFLLSRRHEFQADSIAARVTDASVLAMALWRLACVNPWLTDGFWPNVRQLACSQPEPPTNVLDLMRAYLTGTPSEMDAARWVDGSLSEVTGTENSHPSFSARATALGMAPDTFRGRGFPRTPKLSAAAVLLGPHMAEIEQDVALRWRRDVSAAWQTWFRESAHRVSQQRETISDATETDVLTLWEEIRRTVATQSLAAAAPMLFQLLRDNPDHVGASVLLGRHLLESGDESGEELLQIAIKRQDEQWTAQAFDALTAYLRSTGQSQRLQKLRAQIDQFDALLEAARRERSVVKATDTLLAHELEEPLRQSLCAALSAEPDCCRAWLARKQLLHLPQRPLFVLVVSGAPAGWWTRRKADDGQLAARLSTKLRLPGQLLTIPLTGDRRALARRVTAVDGAIIHQQE
jgi:Zn-dependent protease with chaperone function